VTRPRTGKDVFAFSKGIAGANALHGCAASPKLGAEWPSVPVWANLARPSFVPFFNFILTVCIGGAIGALMLPGRRGAGIGASLLFGLIGMAMAGQGMRPQVRAFSMGIFLTVYYAVMLLTPLAAGAILDATGNTTGPLWLAVTLFALVVPLAAASQHFDQSLTLDVEGRSDHEKPENDIHPGNHFCR